MTLYFKTLDQATVVQLENKTVKQGVQISHHSLPEQVISEDLWYALIKISNNVSAEPSAI